LSARTQWTPSNPTRKTEEEKGRKKRQRQSHVNNRESGQLLQHMVLRVDGGVGRRNTRDATQKKKVQSEAQETGTRSHVTYAVRKEAINKGLRIN